MKKVHEFDQRPILVAVAGPNGAGKTTFYQVHLKASGLRFVNADVLARELNLEPYEAAKVAAAVRRELIQRNESFVFETVFSDPVGEKLALLKNAASSGYTVVLCFIGLSDPELCEERVAMRVSQGGHDVPSAKLRSRFPRTLKNLRDAIRELPYVLVYDNSDLRQPFRQIAVYEHGQITQRARVLPEWFKVQVSRG